MACRKRRLNRIIWSASVTMLIAKWIILPPLSWNFFMISTTGSSVTDLIMYRYPWCSRNVVECDIKQQKTQKPCYNLTRPTSRFQKHQKPNKSNLVYIITIDWHSSFRYCTHLLFLVLYPLPFFRLMYDVRVYYIGQKSALHRFCISNISSIRVVSLSSLDWDPIKLSTLSEVSEWNMTRMW